MMAAALESTVVPEPDRYEPQHAADLRIQPKRARWELKGAEDIEPEGLGIEEGSRENTQQ